MEGLCCLATALIILWVLDLSFFCNEQFKKAILLANEIEGNGRNICKSLLHDCFCAVSITLKVLSLMFIIVMYKNIDDDKVLPLLRMYPGMHGTTSYILAGVTFVSLLLVFLLLTAIAYAFLCGRPTTDEDGNSSSKLGICAQGVPLLNENESHCAAIARGVV